MLTLYLMRSISSILIIHLCKLIIKIDVVMENIGNINVIITVIVMASTYFV